jgi:glycosyltransferase involved in cell wall biosynthesis
MKRVAIFRSHLLPISETFIRDQAVALRDWQPVLMGFQEVPGGLRTPGIVRDVVPIGILSKVIHLWFFRSPIRRLVKRFRVLDISLVHAHFGTVAIDIWPSVKAAGLPMLVTLHGYDINIRREWWEAGYGGLRMRAYPDLLLRMARDPNVSFIAVSHAIKMRAIDWGIPEEKIGVAYIGVDTRRFCPGGLPLNQRRNRILFVGRMVEKKAPLLMIQAFAEVRSQVPDAELVMIGAGPLLNDAKRLAAELSVPVKFLGACSSDEVLRQIHEARIFCLLSKTAANGDAEGLPISLLEAQACGVPVVTSMSGGSLEGIKEGETGLSLNPYSLQVAVKTISFLLKNDNATDRMGCAATVFIQREFAIDRLTHGLETLYSLAFNMHRAEVAPSPGRVVL